jgi:adenylate cyclase
LAGRPFSVVRHLFDDSVFIDGEYLIKGVSGRLLVHLLGLHLQEGRADFTNREMRLSDELRLPDFKDNLETACSCSDGGWGRRLLQSDY